MCHIFNCRNGSQRFSLIWAAVHPSTRINVFRKSKKYHRLASSLLHFLFRLSHLSWKMDLIAFFHIPLEIVSIYHSTGTPLSAVVKSLRSDPLLWNCSRSTLRPLALTAIHTPCYRKHELPVLHTSKKRRILLSLLVLFPYIIHFKVLS